MKHLLTLVLAASLVLVQTASAQGPDSRPAERPAAKKAFVFEGEPYLLAKDPTGADLADVEEPVVMQYEGRELRFASERNLKTFRAAPEKYLERVDKEMIADQLPYYPLTKCPVSGEDLGDMGEPIDLVYKNRLVRLCCKMCIKKFRANPDKVIAELNKAAIEQQIKSYPFKTCLVSGEDLEEGEIIDRVVGGRLVRMCCKMCTKKLSKSPTKFVAEVDAGYARVKKQKRGADTKPAR